MARITPVALAALAGASVWISLGQSAVLDAVTKARVAAFPPFSWLALLVIVAVIGSARLSVARAYPLAISLLVWLPYLPGRVPAAFLVWQGPLEGVVWTAIAAGVLFADPPSWLATRMRMAADRRRAPWIAALVAATVYAVGIGMWAGRDLAPVRPALSQWTFLRSWNPSADQVALQLQPFRRVSPEELARRLEVSNLARGPADTTGATTLRASMLPAGEYDLVTAGDGGIRGEVVVLVGQTDEAVERWRLDGRQSGVAGFTLELPVPVHSVTIRADEEASETAREFRLRIRSLSAPAVTPGLAGRAIRYGRTRAFFMDDSSYMEPGGFWTRGDEATTIVLTTDDSNAHEELVLLVRSGAVPTTIELTMGSWHRRVAFAANQLQAVSLPPRADGTRVVTIQTGPWFRPSDHDGLSSDTRRLGLFVTVP